MMIDAGTATGILIALGGSLITMLLFWKENMQLTKTVSKLEQALRDKNGK